LQFSGEALCSLDFQLVNYAANFDHRKSESLVGEMPMASWCCAEYFCLKKEEKSDSGVEDKKLQHDIFDRVCLLILVLLIFVSW
jgi:hypothetical protein